MEPLTPKYLAQRSLLTHPFVHYLDNHHPEIIERLQSQYPYTLLKEGLELQKLSSKDEDLVLNLYREFLHYT